MTIIVRDRAKDDKVVKIREPLDTVALIYNPENDNRLAFSKTVYPNYGGAEVSQIVKLGYEDYLNSNNNKNNVVTNVEQRTYVKKKVQGNIDVSYPNGETVANQKYLKLESELEEMIKKNSKES